MVAKCLDHNNNERKQRRRQRELQKGAGVATRVLKQELILTVTYTVKLS